MKKLIYISFAIVFCLVIVGCNNQENGAFEYNYTFENEIIIKADLKNYIEKESHVIIPGRITVKEKGKKFEDVTVDWIERYAFCGNDFIKQVDIPHTVRGISEGAFIGCRSLSIVVLPESVTVIGDFAFANCLGLEQIHIQKSVDYIGPMAFYGSDNVTIIGESDSYAEAYAKEQGISFEKS